MYCGLHFLCVWRSSVANNLVVFVVSRFDVSFTTSYKALLFEQFTSCTNYAAIKIENMGSENSASNIGPQCLGIHETITDNVTAIGTGPQSLFTAANGADATCCLLLQLLLLLVVASLTDAIVRFGARHRTDARQLDVCVKKWPMLITGRRFANLVHEIHSTAQRRIVVRLLLLLLLSVCSTSLDRRMRHVRIRFRHFIVRNWTLTRKRCSCGHIIMRWYGQITVTVKVIYVRIDSVLMLLVMLVTMLIRMSRVAMRICAQMRELMLKLFTIAVEIVINITIKIRIHFRLPKRITGHCRVADICSIFGAIVTVATIEGAHADATATAKRYRCRCWCCVRLKNVRLIFCDRYVVPIVVGRMRLSNVQKVCVSYGRRHFVKTTVVQCSGGKTVFYNGPIAARICG